jgi:HK97 family phage major capsid protein
MATKEELEAKLDGLEKAVKQKEKQVLTPKGNVNKAVVDPNRAPAVSVGGYGRDSQPFSFTKALVGHIGDQNRANAKFEGDVLTRFRKALIETNSLPPGSTPSAWFLPVNFDHLGEAFNQHPDAQYVKSVIAASGRASDPDEEKWLIRKGVIYKTQSAYTDSLGGTLVAPPTFGDVIPLIRPQAALLAAGATNFPLPPNGRHVRPRITAAPTVQAVAESQDAPESDLSTDQMELSAKKIAGLVRISEEATNYTSGTIDNYAQAELERSLGLKMDAYGFYGTGGPSIPSGLTSAAYSAAVINVATTYPTGRGIGTNGNTLLPQYGDLLPSLIGERSFNMDATGGCWVMRPAAYASAQGVRGDGPVPGDQQGPLVDILRRFGETSPNQWRGRKVVQTTNIRGDRTKGTGTNLSDAFFGIWTHCIVATFGAVQFRQGDDANTVKRGQFIIRGVMFGDIGFEYPAAFLYLPDILGAQDQI